MTHTSCPAETQDADIGESAELKNLTKTLIYKVDLSLRVANGDLIRH